MRPSLVRSQPLEPELCSVRLSVRTPPFHGGKRGSIPLPSTTTMHRYQSGLMARSAKPSIFAGSNPARCSTLWRCSIVGLMQPLHTRKISGSNPLIATRAPVVQRQYTPLVRARRRIVTVKEHQKDSRV